MGDRIVYGPNLLFIAICVNDVEEILRALTFPGVNPNFCYQESGEPLRSFLYCAILKKNVEAVRALLNHEYFKIQECDGSLLYHAISNNMPYDVILKLIEIGKNHFYFVNERKKTVFYTDEHLALGRVKTAFIDLEGLSPIFDTPGAYHAVTGLSCVVSKLVHAENCLQLDEYIKILELLINSGARGQSIGEESDIIELGYLSRRIDNLPGYLNVKEGFKQKLREAHCILLRASNC